MPGKLTRSQRRDVSVVVIGAGFGGISAGMLLRKEGVRNFRIIERNEGVGGTWWSNSYPGAEVDAPSPVYSWAYKRYDWARTHPRQPELQRYIQEVVEERGLGDHLTLGTSVDELTWEEDKHQYRVQLSNDETIYADIVISAVGLLSKPKYPSWPGYADFAGTKVHTARWREDVELAGKRVAVVGVGSSATQVVAAIAPTVDKLYVYQREPVWVLPKGDYAFSDEERERFRTESEFSRRLNRAKHFWNINKGMVFGRLYKPRSRFSKWMRGMAEAYIAETFKDRPDLKEALTPNYGFAGKRVVFNGDFYPALLRDNVELIPRAVERLTEKGIVDTSGTETPVDVLIMGTGFEPVNALESIKIVGRSGKTLAETWGDEPRAFFGISVPDFPNLFMLYGPSTHGGLIFTNHVSQIRWALLAIRQRRRWGRTALEARPTALKWYVKWLDHQAKATAWIETNSYMKNDRGTVITQWPYDAIAYQIMTRVFGRIGHKVR
jgi:cation diffusion facilitator CzcD-associated flavoprotein CzcO